MKIIFLLISFCLLYSCEKNQIVLSEKEKQIIKDKEKIAGEERSKMFVKCMELAAKMPRQADDDVSDVVDSCSSESYYITNYLRK